jgi:hypothetical protein
MITQELSATEADAVQRVGAGWVVLNFNWDEVDRRCPSAADLPDCRDYAGLDAMVDAANGRGLEVLADLSYTAAWANGTGIKQSPPRDLQDYDDYIFDIAARYAPRVKAWKIWNEPNLAAFLTPGDHWMEWYHTYVTRAYAAIKRVDADARIVGPDLSYHALAGGSLSEFSRIMTDYGWWAFDIVSVHHYDDDGVPIGVRLDEGVQPFRFGKSVWITETGQRWSTAGQTLASQQRYYLRALADADDRRDWVTDTAYVSIGQVPATDEIVFTTATESGVRTIRAVTKREFEVGSVTLELTAGTSAAETSAPGTIVFDRVSVAMEDGGLQ